MSNKLYVLLVVVLFGTGSAVSGEERQSQITVPTAPQLVLPDFDTYLGRLDVGTPLRVGNGVTVVDPFMTVASSWDRILPRRDGGKSLSSQASLPVGSLSGSATVRDPRSLFDDPTATRSWQQEESLRVPLLGALFVYGKLGASCGTAEAQDVTLSGRTGLDWKLLALEGKELSLRGGPCLSCPDVLRTERLQEQKKMLVEMNCRWQVFGPLKLEYAGSATSGLAATERSNQLSHDLGFTVPLGTAGSLRCGARGSWDRPTPTGQWTDSLSLYLGVALGK